MSEDSTFTTKQKKMWAALLAGRTVRLISASGKRFTATWKGRDGVHYLHLALPGEKTRQAITDHETLRSYVAGVPDSNIVASGRRGSSRASRDDKIPLPVLERRICRLQQIVKSRGGNVDCAPTTRTAPRKPAQLALPIAATSPRVELPRYSYSARQPDPPSRSNVVARFTDEAGISYRVERNRPGSMWWVSASKGDRRWSNTLRTTSKAKGEAWRAAVETGNVGMARNDD